MPAAAPPRSAARARKPVVNAHFDEVLDQVKWGDVLLFKCKQPHTAVIRGVTNCKWDHVGMVALDGSGELIMLEACVLGVRSFPLHRRVHEYRRHFADAIGWRRLLANRSEAGAAACRAFVEEVDGKRYDYNPLKILFTLRDRRGGGGASSGGGGGTENAYYCSELVCALWQHVGFMQRGCRAASFWPADLANNGVCERWLADGVYLAPEVVMSIDVVPPPPPPPPPLEEIVAYTNSVSPIEMEEEAAEVSAASEAEWSSTRGSDERAGAEDSSGAP